MSNQWMYSTDFKDWVACRQGVMLARDNFDPEVLLSRLGLTSETVELMYEAYEEGKDAGFQNGLDNSGDYDTYPGQASLAELDGL